MTLEELRTFYWDELEWCGCGCAEEALRFMGQVLALMHEDMEAIRARRPSDAEQRMWDLIGMDREKKAPCPMAYSYLYMLDAAGLTEHGSSIRCSWLTDKGRAVLAAIEALPPTDNSFLHGYDTDD